MIYDPQRIHDPRLRTTTLKAETVLCLESCLTEAEKVSLSNELTNESNLTSIPESEAEEGHTSGGRSCRS